MGALLQLDSLALPVGAAHSRDISGAAHSQGALRLALLSDWQRDWPLIAQPYAHIAQQLGYREQDVIQEFSRLRGEGAVSRIGAIWGAGAGGAAMLCAYAVPAQRLEAVAALVSAEPGVNHNYEREHAHNLWFVVTGAAPGDVADAVDRLDACTGLRALRLPMRRAYRIDLGFAISGAQGANATPHQHLLSRRGVPVAANDRPLAALLEAGLPLLPRPYDDWAQRLGLPLPDVLATLARWQQEGTVRRLGVIVRHHELGISHNAMTVFNVPDAQVDAVGAVLACQSGVTLCYQRARAEGWPFNLYCMVHGRDRRTVQGLLQAATQAAGLGPHTEHAVLFSRRRFKQQGARYFRDAVAVPPVVNAAPSEAAHACQ